MEPQQNYDVPIGVVLDNDGNDSGPATLQNTDIRVDNFEGVIKMNDSTNDQTEYSRGLYVKENLNTSYLKVFRYFHASQGTY